MNASARRAFSSSSGDASDANAREVTRDASCRVVAASRAVRARRRRAARRVGVDSVWGRGGGGARFLLQMLFD